MNCQFIVFPHLNADMDIMEEIVNRLKKNNMLLVAPTGWGKTTLMMRVAIRLGKEGYRVGLIAPTLTLLVKKWPQLQQMLTSTPSPPRAILTAGAGQYCVYKWNIPQRQCPRCRLYHVSNVDIVSDVVAFEDVERTTPEDKCGYWIQESSLHRFNIIAGHYGRLPKIVRYIHYLLVDEAHEFYLPHISSYPLHELAELLGVSAEELNITVIKELVAEKLSRLDLDPITEDRLYSLSSMLKKTCWIENENLNCLDTYDLPRGIRVFATTATPPPGWPPEGWGEKIEIEPHVKPRAYVEPEAKFFYSQNYEGAPLLLYLIIQWLRKEFNTQHIAVFATLSLRSVLQHSLPPGVELFPAGG